jgi:hypothetical protein
MTLQKQLFSQHSEKAGEVAGNSLSDVAKPYCTTYEAKTMWLKVEQPQRLCPSQYN